MNSAAIAKGQTLLHAKGIGKQYRIGSRAIPVIRGVDLEVKKGEMLAIVGASGAGKSTLLHILGLLDNPTEGDVFFAGRATSGLGSAERARIRNRSIGFVFQFYHLIPELSALQNTLLQRMVGVSLFEWMGRAAEEKQRGEELLTRFGLKDRLAHRPGELSGGERQRVAIARALLPKPEVLLCDEPTGNLDSTTGVEILDILGGIHEHEGTTFVIVTHDERVARRCQRVIRMTDGKIVQEK